MPRKTIADAASELLVSRRAATSEDLAEPIAAAGLTRAKSPIQAVSNALRESHRFVRLDDGRWVVPAQLLDDAVLTRRPTPLEVEHAALSLVPDLAPLMAVGVFAIATTDGEGLTGVWGAEARALTGADTDAAIQGPPGWLESSDGKPLLHVRFERGAISANWGPEPDAAARMTGRRIVETVRRTLGRDVRAGDAFALPRTVSLSNAVLAMLVDEAELLREPLAPLGSMFEGGGLEAHRGWVGYAGTDWEALDAFMDFDDDWGDADAWDDRSGIEADDEDEVPLEAIAERLGLDDEDVKGLQVLMAAYELDRRGRGLEDSRQLAGLAAIVTEPSIAWVLGGVRTRIPDLEPFIANLEQAAVGVDVAGPRYVLATFADDRDDVEAAERFLRSALEADPGFAPAVAELARIETDRGRYGEALQLLRSIDIPTDDLERAWLEDVSRSALPRVGRNQPCPCGSGRKYKACHLGREGDAVRVEPARALPHKLWLWLDRAPSRRLMHELLVEAVPGIGRPELDDEDRDRLEDPILHDVMLFDRGELEHFLRARGALLPEQERDLGRSWLATHRSVYEVRSVRPGTDVTVRDLLTEGTDVTLGDRTMSRQVESLDLLCLRLLPDGTGGLTPSSGLLVPRSQRMTVIDIVTGGDPLALLRWSARPAPMPQLSNTEGETLQLVDATYRVPEPDAAANALRSKLREEDEGAFVEVVARDGQDLIRGSITIDGDVARVEANSRTRADRLERLLMRAAPGSRLIRREEQGIEDVLEASREDDGAVRSRHLESAAIAADPAVAEAMEQFMREHERRWVDERIPALGGLTPRQALDDPVMRRELEALLDDMIWQARRTEGTSTMDPDRIRQLLGLDVGGGRPGGS